MEPLLRINSCYALLSVVVQSSGGNRPHVLTTRPGSTARGVSKAALQGQEGAMAQASRNPSNPNLLSNSSPYFQGFQPR